MYDLEEPVYLMDETVHHKGRLLETLPGSTTSTASVQTGADNSS